MSGTTCTRCGAAVPPAAKFCPSCGLPQAAAAREERRVVTVLFGDLAGFTELAERRDAEEVKQIVGQAFERLAEIVVSFGGRVDKIIGDEIMAVWGAPQAHEDDPERAVRAALAIQRELQERSARVEQERGISLQMHIGVNTGEVVAGHIGGSDSYTVLGDAVNTARRIEDAAAGGQILVGAATHEATTDVIAYRRVGDLSAKGKRLPVEVWEALAERGLPGARPMRAAPLIGREEELDLLTTLASLVRRDQRPMLATIVSDAGMGKSRLASELARRLTGDGVRVIQGRSLPYGTASPAFAVEEIMRAALRIDPGATVEESGAWVAEQMEQLGAPADTDAIRAFLGLGGAMPSRAGAPGRAEGPSVEARVGLDSAASLLERIARAEGMLVLAFHDLHWGSETVLDFVVRLVGGTRAPILILGLARPTLLERRDGWGSVVGSTVLSLEPLPRERAAEMLDLLAPEMSLAAKGQVLDRAGGNPFFIEELARLIGDRPARSDEPVSVPSSVQALVAARLDALPAAEKQLIQDAAVVGDVFWPGALTALGAEASSEALAEQRLSELIEPVDAGPIPGLPTFRFRQTLVREVAYASVPKQSRARYHLAVGAWIESAMAPEERPRELDDLIAYHYERAAVLAGEVGEAAPEAAEKARAFLERAGDRALGLDASRSAADLFRRAVPFARDDADLLGLRIRLAEALVGTWRHEEGRAELDLALSEARRLGDRSTEARALRLLGDSYRMAGPREDAHAPLAEAMAIAEEIGDEAEQAAVLRARGQLDLFAGRWTASIESLRAAHERYRTIGDPKGEAWSLQNLGWASMFLGKYDDALASLEQSQGIFEQLGDDEGVGWCIGMRGWVLLLRGDVIEAGTIAEELEGYLRDEQPEYLLDLGFTLELQRILRAYVYVLTGRTADAMEMASEALRADIGQAGWVRALGSYVQFAVAILRRDLATARAVLVIGADGARESGDPLFQGQAVFGEAWLAYEEGRLDEAEASLGSLTGPDELGYVWRSSASTRWLTASIAIARGDVDAARALLEESVGRQGIGLIAPSRARALLSEILVATGDVARALEEARVAVDEAGQDMLSRVYALLALADAHLANGDAEEAEATVRAELAVVEETDYDVERIKGLALLARILDVRRRFDESSEVLDRARALLDDLEPGADRGPVEALLRS